MLLYNNHTNSMFVYEYFMNTHVHMLSITVLYNFKVYKYLNSYSTLYQAKQ